MLSTGLSTGSLVLATLALLASAYSLAALQQLRAELALVRATVTHAASSNPSAKLSAELAELASAIEVDRAALKKQLGKIWGTIGRDISADRNVADSTDPDFEAIMNLQRAHSSGDH